MLVEGMPTIAKAKKAYGERFVLAYVTMWIIKLNELLNVKRQLTEVQIDQCAEMILSQYYTITVADINLIVKTALIGGYGKLYDSLSIDKILSWFDNYNSERQRIAGEMSRQEHDKIKYIEEKEETRTLDIKKMNEIKKEVELKQFKEKYKNKE